MQFNLIGAGRLGKNLAVVLSENSEAKLKTVCNSSLESAAQAVSLIGCGKAVATLKELPAADLTIITTPDDRIALVVNDLLQYKLINPGSIVIHCSGVLSSATLAPLRELSCAVASFHPLKAFPTGMVDKNALIDCHCVLEGDANALAILSDLFKSSGAHLMTINADKKAGYHAAAVIASNYLVTLAATAIELLNNAGIEEIAAHKMITQLMQSSLTNVQKSTKAMHALTGPLARGDMETINYHLQALKGTEMLPFYTAAALATLPLTGLTADKKESITELLLSF